MCMVSTHIFIHLFFFFSAFYSSLSLHNSISFDNSILFLLVRFAPNATFETFSFSITHRHPHAQRTHTHTHTCICVHKSYLQFSGWLTWAKERTKLVQHTWDKIARWAKSPPNQKKERQKCKPTTAVYTGTIKTKPQQKCERLNAIKLRLFVVFFVLKLNMEWKWNWVTGSKRKS